MERWGWRMQLALPVTSQSLSEKAALLGVDGARWNIEGLFVTASATGFVVGAALWWVWLRRSERRTRRGVGGSGA